MSPPIAEKEENSEKNYPQNEKEANTFLSMYVLGSYFYICMRLINDAFKDCVKENPDYTLFPNNFLNWDELSIVPDNFMSVNINNVNNYVPLVFNLDLLQEEPEYDFIGYDDIESMDDFEIEDVD